MEGVQVVEYIWTIGIWLLGAVVVVELYSIMALLAKIHEQGERRL